MGEQGQPGSLDRHFGRRSRLWKKAVDAMIQARYKSAHLPSSPPPSCALNVPRQAGGVGWFVLGELRRRARAFVLRMGCLERHVGCSLQDSDF